MLRDDGREPTGTFSTRPTAFRASRWLDRTQPPPWHETTIVAQPAGGFPNAPLIQDARGVLYGTNDAGGAVGKGAVYALAPSAAGKPPWAVSVLYSFAANQSPNGGLNLGRNHILYGTTYTTGGCRPRNMCGTVFKLAPPPSMQLLGTHRWIGIPNWTQTVLYAFSGGIDGGQPAGGLLADPSGTVYGTTSLGGFRGSPVCAAAGGCGTVFKLTPSRAGNGAWTQTVLHAFTSIDGSSPHSTLVADAGGALYGTTTAGGTGGVGTIFQLKPPSVGNASWTFNVLHAFTYADGTPNDPLIVDARGGNPDFTFCCGTAFKLTPPSAAQNQWTEQDLYDFGGGDDGEGPTSGLLLSRFGAYGITYGSSCPACGNVFRLTPP